jgi:hypothetical protein
MYIPQCAMTLRTFATLPIVGAFERMLWDLRFEIHINTPVFDELFHSSIRWFVQRIGGASKSGKSRRESAMAQKVPIKNCEKVRTVNAGQYR